MHFRDRAGPRDRRRAAVQRLSPDEQAEAVRLALKWRQEWRDEKVAPAISQTIATKRPPGADDARRRAKFAEAMARAELGRSYWDERLRRT